MSKNPAPHNRSAELKSLHGHRVKLTARIANMTSRNKQHHPTYIKACDELNQVLKQIADLHQEQVVVTEHALLRYLERVKGVDVAGACEEFMTDQLRLQIKTLGDGKYPIGGGYRVIVKNSAVITIVEN